MTVIAVLQASSREALGMARQLDLPVEAVAPPADATPEAAGAALAALVAELAPTAVLAPATDHGTETMAHLAARTGLPLAANCVSVRPHRVDHGQNLVSTAGTPDSAHDQREGGGDVWAVTRVRGGGVLWEEAELTAPTKLVTVAPGSVPPVEDDDLPTVRELPVGDTTEGARLVERATTTGGGVSLATAPVVVSGGRGIGSAEGFAVLEELAELVGGAVGCSRVATNNGWRPHSDQVGQTGTKVAPDLYIAAGISGATQHWAGCMGSKTILAVNTDPEAPMVTRADYAVIGDAGEVLQAVVEELRRRQGAVQ